MNKYIFIDCDGTIVPYHQVIPSSTLQALSQAKINGCKLVLTTGRYLDELTEDILQIGFDGFILNSGSFIQYQGKVLFNGAFPIEQQKAIVDYLRNNHYQFRLETTNKIFQSPNFESYFDDFLQDNSIYDYQLINDDNCYRDDVIYIYVALDDPQLKQIKEDFPYCDIFDFKKNNKTVIASLNMKGLNKGTAVSFLMQHLNINKEDTISIGDDYNDIALFDVTNLSICMGQADKFVQQHADYVTEEITKDGIYKALKHFHII